MQCLKWTRKRLDDCFQVPSSFLFLLMPLPLCWALLLNPRVVCAVLLNSMAESVKDQAERRHCKSALRNAMGVMVEDIHVKYIFFAFKNF